MKIFSFFKGKADLDKASTELEAKELRTRRNHPRYQVADSGDCVLEHAQAGIFRVVDISFKGCLLEGVGEIALDESPGPVPMTLSLFGQKLAVGIKEIQKRKNGWAVVFEHTSDEFVMGLSTVLEPLRCGSTCIEIPKDTQKDLPHAPIRKRYSGDGPLDVVVERDDQNQLVFSMVTIRRASVYASVLWENGTVITKKTVDKEGVGARMGQTPEPSLDLVVYAATACLGMRFIDGRDVAKCFGDWLKNNS